MAALLVCFYFLLSTLSITLAMRYGQLAKTLHFSTGHDKHNADYFNIVNNNVNEINTDNRIRRSVDDDSSSSNGDAKTVTLSPMVDEVKFAK